jgi:archaemetzincin
MTVVPGGAHAGGGLLVPVGSVNRADLDYLELVLGGALGLPFRIHNRPMSADAAYDPMRRQWNAGKLLSALDEVPEARGARRILGVTEADLFIPILTFVFGLAYLDGRAALVSTHRLHPELYGLAPDRDLVLRRLEKEALHEIGHTFGLTHCKDYGCVMHFSNTADEVDLKGARFCLACEAKAPLGLERGR